MVGDHNDTLPSMIEQRLDPSAETFHLVERVLAYTPAMWVTEGVDSARLCPGTPRWVAKVISLKDLISSVLKNIAQNSNLN